MMAILAADPGNSGIHTGRPYEFKVVPSQPAAIREVSTELGKRTLQVIRVY